MSAAFGSMTISRWNEVIAETDAVVARGETLPEIYFMRGFAYCNLKDYPAAEAAYSKGIELDPDYPLLYLLRAEVRQKQGNLLGAGADTLAVANSPQGAMFAPLIALAIGTPALAALSVAVAALTSGLPRSGALGGLLLMPLAVPLLIFGAAAATGESEGALKLEAAIALLIVAGAPFVTGAAIRAART